MTTLKRLLPGHDYFRRIEGEAYFLFNKYVRPLKKIEQRADGTWDVGESTHNNDIDAFRHAYVSYKLAWNLGVPQARIMMGANELQGDIFNKQPPAEKSMDLWNNEFGYDIMPIAISDEHAGQLIAEGMRAGKLVVSPDDPRRFSDYRALIYDLNSGKLISNPYCFGAGTPIRMADGSSKPIEEIRVGDMVMAFDPSEMGGRGTLKPSRVSRTFTTPNQRLIDLHGLKVTPGHEFLCGDASFRTIKEILETDGTIVREDGTEIRARTGAPVGGKADQVIPVGYRDATGAIRIAYLRAGTPYARRNDEEKGIATLLDRMADDGFHLRPDGRFENINGEVVTAYWEVGQPDQGWFVAPSEAATKWTFVTTKPSREATLPNPMPSPVANSHAAKGNRKERRRAAAELRRAARQH